MVCLINVVATGIILNVIIGFIIVMIFMLAVDAVIVGVRINIDIAIVIIKRKTKNEKTMLIIIKCNII